MMLFSGCMKVENSDEDSLTITFDSNAVGVTGTMPVQKIAQGDSAVLLGNSFNRENWDFAGWAISSNGAVVYADGANFTMGSSNVTLYAQWVLPFQYSEMVEVPGGTWRQEDVNGLFFTNTVSSFKMGKYEVTYDLWYQIYSWATNNGYSFQNPGCEGNSGNPGDAPGDDRYHPVTTINWRDAIVWCNAFSQRQGFTPVYCTDSGFTTPINDSRDGGYSSSTNITPGAFDNPYINMNATGYRLPTEGEWMYAASYIDGSGYLSYDHVSGDLSGNYTNSSVVDYYAWHAGNAVGVTHAVGLKLSNHLGIYDMSGNVAEWCQDWYSTNWPSGLQTDYSGPTAAGLVRIAHGGWYASTSSHRVGDRGGDRPYVDHQGTGFRFVRRP